MQLDDLLNQLGGTQSIARELGVDASQVQNGAAALLPVILGGFKKQAQGGGVDCRIWADCLDSSVAAAMTCSRLNRPTPVAAMPCSDRSSVRRT